MSKKVVHYRDKCIGCGACIMYAPSTWQQNDDDGLVDLINGQEKGDVVVSDIDDVLLEENKNAEESCPTQAIKIQ